MPQNDPTTCQKPGRDVPEIVCGWPLPCPHHAVVIDATKKPALVDGAEGLPRTVRRTLQEIGDTMTPEEKE